MKYYIVPIAYVIDDDSWVKPELRIIKAKDPYEALEKLKETLIEEDRKEVDDPDYEPEVWYYNQEETGEEGYCYGDPIELMKTTYDRDEMWDKIKAQVMEDWALEEHDMDIDSVEDDVNRETDRKFKLLFGSD